jgi:hypothetical protein
MRTSVNNFITTLVVITFILSANSTAFSQYECQPQPMPAVINDSIVAADPDQSTRVFRPGGFFATTCLSAPGSPGTPLAGTFNHDAHAFTNTTGQPACITVRLNTACTGTNFLFAVAYSTYNPATPNTGIIGHIGGSPAGTPGTPAYFSFPVAAGASYTVVVSEVTANAGCPAYTLTVETSTACRQPGFDRNNDGAADFAVFRPAALANWFNRSTSTGTVESRQFGTTGDIPVHGDYTGDGQTDLAVYRPGNSTFYYATNQTNPASGFVAIPWGVTGDIPVPGDYDSDGRHDINIFRPSDGNWYTLRSGSNTMQLMHWGASGDTPVSGDFDGDTLADYAIARPAGANYNWYVLLSNFNYSTTLNNGTGGSGAPGVAGWIITWGAPSDKIAVGDYNGDAKTDLAVWRPSDGTMYIRFSTSSAMAAPTAAIPWGTNGDIPQPADYDNDKITDVAIYRPSSNAFWVRPSGGGSPVVTFMGTAGDQPVSAPYPIQ